MMRIKVIGMPDLRESAMGNVKKKELGKLVSTKNFVVKLKHQVLKAIVPTELSVQNMNFKIMKCKGLKQIFPVSDVIPDDKSWIPITSQ